MEKISDLNPMSHSADRHSYRKRILIFFGSGAAACILSFFFFLLTSRSSNPGSFDPRLSFTFFLLAPILFMVGVLLLLLAKLSLGWMRFVDASVILLVFASWIFIDWASKPPPALEAIFGILLLWHAVMVPSSTRLQATLGIVAVAAFLSGKILAGYFSTSVHFWSNVAAPSLELMVWAAIAAIMAHSLCKSRANILDRLGNYHVIRELGFGGMGKVYEATHTYLCRPTALKVMQIPPNTDAENAIARFEKEIKFSATLTHPNTITLFDFGRAHENIFFYAMELLDGLDLQNLVARFGPLPASRAIYILLQATGALSEAHEKKIIHRDIKPSNIFLSHQGGLFDFVKILDFGLAKELKVSKKDLTEAGELLGTPRYLAPESISSEGSCDCRTDIYMLGAVAYFMVSGRAPFEAKTSVELIAECLSTPPKKPSEVSELKIPPKLDDIILKCLEKNQVDRFQTVQDLAKALRQVPIEEPWDEEKAESWWKLHFPGEGASLPAKESVEPIVLKTIDR